MSSDDVRDSYDAHAELYASLFLTDLEHDALARERLAVFAELAVRQDGHVADLGCGPGHVTNYLSGLGLRVVGSDLSPGQIEQARLAFVDLDFRVGDLTVLPDADRSLGGIVSRYSLIHLPPADLGAVFAEWRRALGSGAPLLVSFFGSRSADAHGTPFDHKVATAYELWPNSVAQLMSDAGFVDVDVRTEPIPEGGRPFDNATVLGRSAENGPSSSGR